MRQSTEIRNCIDSGGGDRSRDAAAGAELAAAENLAGGRPSNSDSSPLLVTGASGFVGSAIAAALRAASYPLRVLVRPSSPRTNLSAGDTVCEGDLRDRPSVARALKGVRFLFHAAADYRLWAPEPDDIIRNNVEGTRLIMEEALRAGVERIVYTSSVATLGLAKGIPATESNPLSEETAIGAYKRSKVAAERLVETMVRRERATCGDRQSLDTRRSSRCEAHAHRTDDRRGCRGANARICRHRTKPCPCR